MFIKLYKIYSLIYQAFLSFTLFIKKYENKRNGETLKEDTMFFHYLTSFDMYLFIKVMKMEIIKTEGLVIQQ